MKKNILFVIPEHTHGGTNKSLLNLISLLDKEKYCISIYCINQGGFYKSLFRKYSIPQSIAMRFIYHNGKISKLFRRIDRFFSYIFSNHLFKNECRRIMKENIYDSVIAFQEGVATRFSINFIHTNLIAWVQCDYTLYLNEIKHPFDIERTIYHCYNKIVCVSACTSKVMQKVFPELIDRIDYAYNTLDISMTQKLSLMDINDNKFENTSFTIVSIGRFVPVKRFSYIPQIVRSILDYTPDLKFKWYIIADGDGEKEKTDESIKSLKVQDYVIILGAKDNPYPYIKNSNLLVCLSASESWSYVLNEAMLLHVPVVSTDFEAAIEVVDKNVGILSRFEEIPIVLLSLINNTNGIYSRIEENSKKYQYTNKLAISQVERIFDSHD